MKKILVVGLGNVGEKYTDTRHNIGITVLRQWVQHYKDKYATVRDWNFDKKSHGEIAQVTLLEGKVVCLFPHTLMNDSGLAVAATLKNQGLDFHDVIVIHDELELPFGEIALREQGSAQGHNGMRSVFDHLATDAVTRLRIGIGRPSIDQEVSSFVLANFTKEEQEKLKATVVASAVQELSRIVTARLLQE